MATKVVVIGAGWSGLVTAKTYLQIDNTIKLVILEADEKLGGTWSPTRVYPNLLAQQPWGLYEYADMSLNPPEGAAKDGFIPAGALYNYMVEYADRYSLLERIKFNTEVTSVSKISPTGQPTGQWLLSIKGQAEPMICDKLIVATGLTSRPNFPSIPIQDGFQPPVFHTRDLGKEHGYLTSSSVETVTVYGGGKSAIDVMHLCVRNGKQVNWIVRPGHGSPPLMPGIFMGRNTNDFATTRLSSKLHPALHSTSDRWYQFFHSGKSSIGHWLHWKYWGFLSSSMIGSVGYDKSENMAKVKPELVDHGVFWVNVPTALITQPEIYKWIHDGTNIKVYRNRITELCDTRKVKLDDGQVLEADAVVYATGYDASPSIFSTDLGARLGMATPVEDYPEDLDLKWTDLEKKADARVIELFPRLGNPPAVNIGEARHTPYRLYRHLVPSEMIKDDDRSLVFAGAIGSLSTPIAAEVTALWAAAWLSGNLDLKQQALTQDEIEWDIALANAFSRRRYLNAGVRTACTYHLYEYLPLVDSMLSQLGVNPTRKQGALNDLFSPYMPKDYRGMVEEWMAAHGKQKETIA